MEILTCSQGETRAATAVAHRVGFAIAINVRHFVHQAILFGFFQDGVALFFRDSPTMALLNEIASAFVELNAHILLKMAASFAHKTTGYTARARSNGDVIRLFNVMGDFLVFANIGVAFNR